MRVEPVVRAAIETKKTPVEPRCGTSSLSALKPAQGGKAGKPAELCLAEHSKRVSCRRLKATWVSAGRPFLPPLSPATPLPSGHDGEA